MECKRQDTRGEKVSSEPLEDSGGLKRIASLGQLTLRAYETPDLWLYSRYEVEYIGFRYGVMSGFCREQIDQREILLYLLRLLEFISWVCYAHVIARLYINTEIEHLCPPIFSLFPFSVLALNFFSFHCWLYCPWVNKSYSIIFIDTGKYQVHITHFWIWRITKC